MKVKLTRTPHQPEFAFHVHKGMQEAVTGREWVVTLLVEGWSLNNRFYAKETLEQFKDLMEAMPGGKTPLNMVFIGEMFNHIPADISKRLRGGPAGNMIGFLSEPLILESDGRAVLTAKATISNGLPSLQTHFKDMFESNAADLLGLSLNAEGVVEEGFREGRRGFIVEEITKLISWEVVTEPAAGGGFDKIVASMGGEGGQRTMKFLKKLLAAIAKKAGVKFDEGASVGQMIESLLKNGAVREGSVLQAGLNKILDVLVDVAESEQEGQIKSILQSDFTADLVIAGVVEAEEDGAGDGDGDGSEGDGAGDGEGDEGGGAGDGDGSEGDGDSAAQEAVDKQIAKLVKAVEAQGKTIDGLKKDLEGANARADVAEAEAVVNRVLAGLKLPEDAKAAIAKTFDGQTGVTESAVREAVRDQRKLIKAYVGDDYKIDSFGESKDDILTEGRDELDKHQAALDLFFGYSPDKDDPKDKVYEGIRPTSLKKAYVYYTGDELVEGVLDPSNMRGGKCKGMSMQEAISTGTFSFALGTSMNKRLMQAYRAFETNWRVFADVVPVNDFKQQDRIQWGSIGDIPTVAEGATYTELTVPSDFRAIYTPTKRGGLVSITRESILNDDLRLISRTPQMIARAANRVLEKFVMDLLLNFSGTINGGVIFDGGPLYSAAHGNLGSAALDNVSLEDAKERIFNQTDSAGNDTLGLEGVNLVIPRELRQIATVLNNSDKIPGSAENDINTHKGTLENIVVSPFMRGDKNNWFLTAAKAMIDMIEIGFINGQEVPLLIAQDNPAVGTVFTNDKIRWKVRHEYGGAVTDFRGLDGSIVA